MPMQTLHLEQLISSHMQKDFAKRTALHDISTAIAKSKKVVVVSGAGISCSSGIPDFRSADGLYSLVKARYPDAFVTGKDLFSSQLFLQPQTCSLFYTFIAELYYLCQAAQPTPTHHFISRLHQKKKLLRSYTQNIDGLERRIGLNSGGRGKGLAKTTTKNVELHGDLGRVRCVLCMKDYEAKSEWMELFRDGRAPGCPACSDRCEDRMTRSARATPIGSLRPSIVLYDEPHPLSEDIGSLQIHDISRQPEVLLIMGTSLKVHGLKRLVKEFAKVIHAPGGTKKRGIVVFVNKTPPPAGEWESVVDYWVQGETDAWVKLVEHDWRHVKPSDWERQELLDGRVAKMKKPVAKSKGKGKAHLPTPDPDESSDLTELDTDPDDNWNVFGSPKKCPLPASSTSDSIIPSSNTSVESLHAQLPTPPRSPRRPSRSVSATCLTALVTPLSPSKRRGNVPPEPHGSPTKKVKAYKSMGSSPSCVEDVFGSPSSKSPPHKRRVGSTRSSTIVSA